MSSKPIDSNTLNTWMADYPRWTHVSDTITADFKFKNFVEAFGFLTQLALLAEKQNHHPTIENTYNRVTLILTTHEADNKVTQRDIKLAQSIEGVYHG